MKVFSGLVRTVHTKIAFTRWNHTEVALGWNFAPVFKTQVELPWDVISPWVKHVSICKSFLIDRGNFPLGWISPQVEISCVTGLLESLQAYAAFHQSSEVIKLFNLFEQISDPKCFYKLMGGRNFLPLHCSF